VQLQTRGLERVAGFPRLIRHTTSDDQSCRFCNIPFGPLIIQNGGAGDDPVVELLSIAALESGPFE
jgi:hypothetical protein